MFNILNIKLFKYAYALFPIYVENESKILDKLRWANENKTNMLSL